MVDLTQNIVSQHCSVFAHIPKLDSRNSSAIASCTLYYILYLALYLQVDNDHKFLSYNKIALFLLKTKGGTSRL
jgi:hypothetical protein